MPFFSIYDRIMIEDIMKKIKEWAYRDKRVFAEGLSGTKLYLIYIIGSIFGVYFEQIRNRAFADKTERKVFINEKV
jgi:hypothetical protein